MRLLSKVVWSEGMYLGPHHFQVQSRYFEDSLGFLVSALACAPYGLSEVEFDPDAIRGGKVALRSARGSFPDGLQFQIPESDPLPAARPIGSLFPPTRDFVTVMLAIPPRKSNGTNCAAEGSAAQQQSRFVIESRVLHDENDGGADSRVPFARKNFRLFVDTEPGSDLQTIPIARVIRDGSGRFAYDPDYVPPVMQIGASSRLILMLERLIDILDDKSSNISRMKAGSIAAFATRQIAMFWMLHAVNSALPPLRHLYATKRGHPEELFRELSRLAGALCTFAQDSHPRDLPLYDHDRLGECFDRLERHIRTHLETSVPVTCVTIPLVHVGGYFYEGEITDTRCLDRSRWVFGIRANMGETELMMKVPQLIKICTPPFVRELVRRALPGMELTYLPVPPPAVSPRVETQYFGVARSGPCWDHMVKTHKVGAYVPGEFVTPELELSVVLEN